MGSRKGGSAREDHRPRRLRLAFADGSLRPRPRRQWECRGGIVRILALALTVGLAACGDQANELPLGPIDPVIEEPVLASRIDGKPLDRAKLDRFRAFGEGCTFMVADPQTQGFYRRIAVKRSQLPFNLRPIRKDAITTLGDGKYIRGLVRSPVSGAAVRIGCYVPGDMRLQEFMRAIAASDASPRWRRVLDELARERPVPDAELQRPLSPEAREFLYELAPAMFRAHPAAPVHDDGTRTFGARSSRMDGCDFATLRGFSSEAAQMGGDTLTCECRDVITPAMDGSERVEEECFIIIWWGGGGGEEPVYPDPPAPEWPADDPNDYGEERDQDNGGTAPTPDPDACTTEPLPGEEPVPYGPDGWYLRNLTACPELPVEPPTEPLCDDQLPGCLKPLTTSDKQILELIGVFVDRNQPVCDTLYNELQRLVARTDTVNVFRGDSTLPDNTDPEHSAAYNLFSGVIHIDEQRLEAAKTSPNVVDQMVLASDALHEVAHSLGYRHYGESYPYTSHPFDKLIRHDTSSKSCVRY